MIDREMARELMKRFGSPIYAYDLTQAEARARNLISLLPSNSKLYYSFKANPLPILAATLRKTGCRAEISSLGELNAAIKAGFAASEILYGGPGKTREEIHEAIQYGINHFSCESWVDLNRLEQAANGQKVKVLLRVNPSTAPQAKLAMTGVESQFGFEEEQLLALAPKIRQLKNIELFGIHVFYGTQIAPEALVATTRNALEVAARLSCQMHFKCKVVDVGGGFPWPYAQADHAPDLSGVKSGYAELISQNEFARSVELWFESGRHLVASSGTLLATVLDVKESKGKKFIILDTGINHLGGMSGLGRIPRPFVSIEPLEAGQGLETETVDVVGPLCSPLDSIGRNVKLPRFQPDDRVAIPNVGAYGLTASLTGFLSHPPPIEIAFEGKRVIESHRLGWGHQKL